MRLVFLGTSAAQPTERRGLSCTCLEWDGEIMMFDAGEAAQIAFMKSKLGWNKKMKIFITHMHGDHCVGLLGLLQTMSMRDRKEPLEVYGPNGIEEFIAANIKALGFGISFPVLINIVSEGAIYEGKKYTIHAAKASHAVAAFSYRLDERDKPGRFDSEKAVALGVPKGILWNKLQKGETVTAGGNKVMPEQVLGQTRPGRRVGISGDTMPSPGLVEFFRGCDYLVFDSTFLDSEEKKAAETCHSTASQAAALAKEAGVKTLVMTHFSARYRDEQGHIKEASKVHGSVIAASDLLEVEIK